eukprot:CAMPEP_0117476278 /NCGR_PEP_ID=MMETSP0784-20121206/10228_1 /TAXON_ID=39447 /ORGANISM="" /LENGTH=86 /DNA_ID=CAMNT_0005270551 /DNA_START=42 /DNA_END=299 /DNA_ORIENTATION=-
MLCILVSIAAQAGAGMRPVSHGNSFSGVESVQDHSDWTLDTVQRSVSGPGEHAHAIVLLSQELITTVAKALLDKKELHHHVALSAQ